MTSIQCLNFLDHPKKIPPQKDSRFFSSHRGSAGNAEVRRIFHSARPTWSQVPRRFFFLQIDEEAMNQSRGFLVILKNMFT